jgi:hypothetical protein
MHLEEAKDLQPGSTFPKFGAYHLQFSGPRLVIVTTCTRIMPFSIRDRVKSFEKLWPKAVGPIDSAMRCAEEDDTYYGFCNRAMSPGGILGNIKGLQGEPEISTVLVA